MKPEPNAFFPDKTGLNSNGFTNTNNDDLGQTDESSRLLVNSDSDVKAEPVQDQKTSTTDPNGQMVPLIYYSNPKVARTVSGGSNGARNSPREKKPSLTLNSVHHKLISCSQALHQARAPVVGLEPATGGSM
ncbi:hypothetical protein PoB_002626800 [Plakobranchus ocellatus]|uniref:Uncharacterized protein n=1 Tax=Plakobranchus ocellatus TaxID=259542 RepID=A0AAV3ZZ99_9GAST|nr:hypothetical protein PoB_002626800 [Plakobranchus ocellatus]